METTFKKNYKLKDEPERYSNLIEQVKPIATDYFFRWSFRDVPHLLLELSNKITYSICYFGKSKTWRIFYPYLGSNQQKKDFSSEEEVLKFLKDQLVSNKT